MTFAFAALAAVVVWALPGAAQGEKQPFQLEVEKRRIDDGTGASGNGAPTSLRISRDRLGLNAMTPLTAPNGAALNGAKVDASQFNLHARDFALPGEEHSFANPLMQRNGALLAPTGRAPLRGSVSAKALADYDIELLVDQSMSMRQRDCPGGLSRWDWCGQQLNDLSNQLSQYCPHGFTLTTFAGYYQTFPNATAQELHDLFANPGFNSGTKLAEPLQARFSNYFSRRNAKSKPLLIVVITDGVPHPKYEPDMVANTLIDATSYMHSPKEVTVVFFQIGGSDRWGRAFLESMDNDLVPNGARYDIVHNVEFEDLQSMGLTNALVSTVKSYAGQAASR